MKADVDDWKADHQSWSAGKEGLLAAIKQAAKGGKTTDDLESQLRQLEKAERQGRKVPRLVYGDITAEQLAFGLAKQYQTGGIRSAAAGSGSGGHSAGSERAMGK